MRLSHLSIFLILFFLFSGHVRADFHKKIVGATEVLEIAEVDLTFKARVDSGAKTSSIHAENIDIDLSGDPQGKPVSFYLVNKKGQSAKIESTVFSQVTIRTSEGSELRYKVPLTIKWNGSVKTILVTLNNRKNMAYRLLLGRNWLRGDFIVDVDRNNPD